MLNVLTMIDLVLASREQRLDAERRAWLAKDRYATNAIPELKRMLSNPERKRSRRPLRLAIRLIAEGKV